MPASTPCRWDIFCKVIDNFGDAGVCWRLARQLANEHGARVRLWIDRPETLDAMRDGTEAPGIDIRQWSKHVAPTDPGEIVIEAFGAKVPESLLAAMVASPHPPVWINLEYLSAENWIEGCHMLPSPHPRLPLTQWFFYPGFTRNTGGLLREADLLIRRDRFMSRGSGPFWHRLGVAPPDAQALRVSLFAYETEGLGGLLEAWRDGDRTVWCAIPESRVSPQVREWANDSLPAGGAPLHRGALTLQTLPFISQDDYDLLLWTCDLNFVRGEDSFVRAQWAAQPFVWQIYRQDEDTHIAKLDAFLCRYLKNAPKNTADALRAFHAEWNPAAGNSSARPGGAWPSLATTLPVLQRHAAQWCDHLAHEIDLAAALAEFAKGKLK